MNHKKYKKIFYREIFFIVLALLFILPLAIHGFVPAGDDWKYHANRILEIACNIKRGNFFPMMYTYTFKRIGYLLGAFYPWLMLLPFSIFKNMTSNINVAIGLGYAFYIFIALNLVYHVTNKLFKNENQAILTSIVYSFSGYILTDCFKRMALGEFLAMIFLPVVVYGFYAVFFDNKKDWPYLAFGMSAIILSHVLSTFITSTLFVILLVVLFHWIDDRKARFIRLGWAILVCIASSAIFFLPFAEQELYQQFNQPSQTTLQVQNFGDVIVQSLNGTGYACGTITILVLIFGMIMWNHLNKVEKASYVIGTITLIIATSLFPWDLLNQTPFNVIQFPFRLYMLVTLFYSVVAGKIFMVMYQKLKRKDRIGNLLLKGAILLTILLPWFGSAQEYLDNAGVGPLWHINDYTPAKGQNDLENVCNHEVISDGSAAILNPNDIISKPNELIFKGQLIDNAVSLDLPTYNYKNIHVYRDGKKINWKPSVNDTVTIHTSKLSGPVTVKYVPSFIDWLGIIVSIGTWVVGIVYYFRKKIISE